MNDDLMDGIMALNTRQFGTVIELMVKIIYKMKDSDDLSFDLSYQGDKIEVKGSRVYKKNKLELNETNLYDVIISNNNKKRLIKQKEIDRMIFDCNIQQIKNQYFDYLYYVLFFSDIIEFFRITPDKIIKDQAIGYSDKQHRGNKGEGQFHINQKNYAHHKKNYFIGQMDYEELKEKLLKAKHTNG